MCHTPNLHKDLEIRKEHIAKCLNNMRKDKLQNIRVQFDQNSCVICLEEFEPDTEICVTNE